jgi:hypothetical protein
MANAIMPGRVSRGDRPQRRCCRSATIGSDNSVVSDATWATLSRKDSTEQLMAALFTVGQYNLVSWALNSFDVPLDDFLPGSGP